MTKLCSFFEYINTRKLNTKYRNTYKSEGYIFGGIKVRKIKYSNVMLLGVIGYIFFQTTALVFGNSINTIVLENEKSDFRSTQIGLIIRDEKIIVSDMNGKIDVNAYQNEKIHKDQTIAYIMQNDKDIKNNEEKIEILNNEINELNSKYQASDSDINKKIISMQLKTKNEQVDILTKNNESNTYEITSPISGIISYKYDGNEKIYNLDILDKISSKDIQDANNDYEELKLENQNIKEHDILARIIDPSNCYIAICIEDEEIENFKLGTNINLEFDSKIVQAKIHDVYKSKEDNVVILKISNQNVEIYDTRVKEFDIIYKQIESLKIPKTAIKEIDGKQGVYRISEQNRKPEFVELKGIIYEDKEFIYIDYYNNKINGISTVSLYDEIILKPNTMNTKLKIK